MIFGRFSKDGESFWVLIVKRRNKWGVIFGFLRFVGLQNDLVIEKELDQICIGRQRCVSTFLSI